MASGRRRLLPRTSSFGWAALLLLVPRGAAAQLSVTSLSDLNFPIVIRGVQLDVRPTDPNAAKFQISGARNAVLSVSFALPAALQGPGSLSMAFGPTSAAWSDKDRVGGSQAFDPRQGVQATVTGKKSIYVWLGGSVLPTASQPSGSYTGTATITVVSN